MKKRRACICALLLACCLLAGCVSAAAESLLEYRLLEDGSAVITGYKGSDTDLEFPAEIDGHPVTVLGRNFGFNTPGLSNLKRIVIPETMTAVEPGALQFARGLEEIATGGNPVLDFSDGVLYDTDRQTVVLYLQTNPAEDYEIPEGIRGIEDMAFFRAKVQSVSFPGSMEFIGCDCFNECSWLSEVNLNEGLKTIGTDAFTNCDRLKVITIPASVTDIGEGAFTDNRLTEVRVAPGSADFLVADGMLINIRDGVVIVYPAKAEADTCFIPGGVTRIGAFAFYRCHNLKRIVFPEGLREIGRKAFVSCNHLTEINLPDSVVLLEGSAFEGNSDAVRLHIPAGLTEITDNFADLAVPELEIPEGVTRIEGSFRSLPALTEVVIPEGVETIGSGSFTFCGKLAAITIPASVTEIGTGFTGCAETLVIRVKAGSYAEQYCAERQLKCEPVSE